MKDALQYNETCCQTRRSPSLHDLRATVVHFTRMSLMTPLTNYVWISREILSKYVDRICPNKLVKTCCLDQKKFTCTNMYKGAGKLRLKTKLQLLFSSNQLAATLWSNCLDYKRLLDNKLEVVKIKQRNKIYCY